MKYLLYPSFVCAESSTAKPRFKLLHTSDLLNSEASGGDQDAYYAASNRFADDLRNLCIFWYGENILCNYILILMAIIYVIINYNCSF